MKLNKKILSLAVVGAMAMGMGISAFAETTPQTFNDPSAAGDTTYTDVTEAGDDEIKVWGQITEGASTEVVSVTVAWGNLNYTYAKGAWDPDTLSYSAGTWTPDTVDTSDKLTITNRSNVAVDAGLSFAPTEAYKNEGVFTGTFMDDVSSNNERAAMTTMNLESAVGHTLGDEPSDEAYLLLDGAPGSIENSEGFVNIGNITVTLAKAAA